MKTVFEVQVRKADGTFLPTKNVLAAPAGGRTAIEVAMEAALAQEDAGADAIVFLAITIRSIDIDATV